MEEKLLDEFQLFCKFRCKYRCREEIKVKMDIDISKYCYHCGDDDIETEFQYENISPCDYCQIEEFIREVYSRI